MKQLEIECRTELVALLLLLGCSADSPKLRVSRRDATTSECPNGGLVLNVQGETYEPICDGVDGQMGQMGVRGETGATGAPGMTETNSGPNVDPSGTWSATLDSGEGTFTFVATETIVSGLIYSVSGFDPTGDSSCSIEESCPEFTVRCATPNLSSISISGNSMVATRPDAYDIAGSFYSATEAHGEITYDIGARIDCSTNGCQPVCNTTHTTTWTAVKESPD